MAATGILYQSLLEMVLGTREEFAGPIRRLQLLPLGFETSYRHYILYTYVNYILYDMLPNFRFSKSFESKRRNSTRHTHVCISLEIKLKLFQLNGMLYLKAFSII